MRVLARRSNLSLNPKPGLRSPAIILECPKMRKPKPRPPDTRIVSTGSP